MQHSDGPFADGDPFPSSAIQFSDDRFCSKLSLLDDYYNDNDDPTTPLLPFLPKWAIATFERTKHKQELKRSPIPWPISRSHIEYSQCLCHG